MNAGKQTLIGCLILAVYLARAAVGEAPASDWQCPHWAICNDDNEPYRPSKHGCHPGDGYEPIEDKKRNDIDPASNNTSPVHLQRAYEDAREAPEGGSGRLLSLTSNPTQATTEYRAKHGKSSKPHHDSDAKDDYDGHKEHADHPGDKGHDKEPPHKSDKEYVKEHETSYPDSKDYYNGSPPKHDDYYTEEHKYKDDYHGDYSYGYSYGPEGLCFTCASGWWSPGGFGPCIPCGGSKESALRFFTDLGASHPHKCLCRPGFGGQNCDLCPANTFSTGGSKEGEARPDCHPCPPNTIGSQPGATNKFECGGCVPGFGGLHCEPCSPGTFSPGGDYAACVSCGPYQTSPPESPSRDYCECRAGYGTIGAGNECELCPLGTFWGGPKSPSQHLTTLMAKPARRVSPCISCSEAFPEGLFTTAARGSTSQSQCVCLAGAGGGSCAPCGRGTFSTGGTTEPCTSCSEGSTTLVIGAASPDACVCAPGTGLLERTSRCSACPPGSWSAGGAREGCRLCPIGMSSPAAATSEQDCFCAVPGYGILDLDRAPGVPGRQEAASCQLCPVGTFSAQIRGRNECEECGPGFTTLKPGSASSTDCVCAVGFGWDGNTCVQCNAPSYQGYLDNLGVPTTTATREESHPVCLVCPGFGGPQIVGGVDKRCRAAGEGPAAYCTTATVQVCACAGLNNAPLVVPTCAV